MSKDKERKKNPIGTAASVAAVVAAGAALAKLLADAGRQAAAQAGKPLELLLRTQYVTQTFTAQDAKTWFQERTGGDAAGKMMVLARVNSETAQKLDYEGVELLNPDEYLLQVILDGNREIADIRLVNFETIEDGLRRLLDEGGGTLYIEE